MSASNLLVLDRPSCWSERFKMSADDVLILVIWLLTSVMGRRRSRLGLDTIRMHSNRTGHRVHRGREACPHYSRGVCVYVCFHSTYRVCLFVRCQV